MGENLDIEDVCHGHPLAREQLIALIEDNVRLRAENEALRQDAGRYRWLRNKANFAHRKDPMVCINPLGDQSLIDGKELDVAVDDALCGKEWIE